MTTYNIETNEPIEIKLEVSDYGNDCVIYVDGIAYAYFYQEDHTIDLNKVKEWVENTYYDGDYLNEQHYASELDGEMFAA